MKRLLILLLLLLIIPPALAEDDPEALFLAAHPGYQIGDCEVNGALAAAILFRDDAQMLCIAERADGVWTLSMESAAALHQDAWYMDEYEVFVNARQKTVSWRCTVLERVEFYSATLENGVWILNWPSISEWWGGDTDVLDQMVLSWGDGRLSRTQKLTDEDDDIIFTKELCPLPAPWLDGMTTLAEFDASLLLTFDGEFTRAMSGRIIELAASELLPGYAFVSGQLLDDCLHLLMDRPDGVRVFVGVTWDGEWRIAESTPLPRDARQCDNPFGYSNAYGFAFGDFDWIAITPFPDGHWGVTECGSLRFRQNHIEDDQNGRRALIGEHPWNDITTIDWSTLPSDYDEALQSVDPRGWAAVSHSAHLYDTPVEGALSLGEYARSSYARVLEQTDGWTHVDIFGVAGWMRTEALSFGQEMAVPQEDLQPWTCWHLDEDRWWTLYDAPDGTPIHMVDDVVILGRIADEWYHIWQPDTGLSGYVRQNEPLAYAWRADTLPQDPIALFLSVHRNDMLIQADVCEGIAAAIMYQWDTFTLCVAEQTDDGWILTVDNDKALHSGEGHNYNYTIVVQPDGVIEWYGEPRRTSAGPHEIWRSEKTDEGWQLPTLTIRDQNRRTDTHYHWQDGMLTRVVERHIGEAHPPVITDLAPVPAAWTKDMTTLADFDLDMVSAWIQPTPTSGHMEGLAVIEAAMELLPNYTFIGGQLLDDGLHLLMDRPDGTRIFVGVTWDDEWQFTESAPLPEGTFAYGVPYSFLIRDIGGLDPALYPNGRWGVSCLDSWTPPYSILSFSEHLIETTDDQGNPMFIVGEHPWGDITTIDWTTLPISIEDTWAKVDSSGWAMVEQACTSDNFLVLYEAPSQNGPYLAKYRVGTPVRVLERQDDWTKVDIFGVEGWMETSFLAFGSDMAEVQSCLRYAQEVIGTKPGCLKVYPTPDSSEICHFDGQALVLGSIGSKWFHIWMKGLNQSGYIRQEEL